MRRVIPINDIAPKAPPCFDSRTQWVAFLQGAAEAYHRRPKGQPPFLGQAGAEVMNPAFRFCTDCLPEKQAQEQRTGACQPEWLKQQAEAEPA